MHKIIVFSGIILFFSASLGFTDGESLTITTYYPSPYGSYNELTTTSKTYLATTSGNVGIGTTNPGAKLQVIGLSWFAANAGYSAGNAVEIGNDAYLADLDRANTMGVYGAQDSTVGSIKLGSAGGTISGYNGNVGIGTASPSQKLDVNGNFIVENQFASADNGGQAKILTWNAGSGGDFWNWYVNSQTNGSGVGTRTLQLWAYPYDGTNGCCHQVMIISPLTSYVTFTGGHNDLAENYLISGRVLRGSLISIDNTAPSRVVVAGPLHQSLLGVISTTPGAVMDADGGFHIGYETKSQYANEKAPIALVGAVPTLVTSQNGSINIGDTIGISAIPGFGAKMIAAGNIVGKALEKLDTGNACQTVSSIESIVWPEDDGKNSKKPCFKLPDGIYVGKIMVAVNVSWYDPGADVLTTNSSGNVGIDTANPKAKLEVVGASTAPANCLYLNGNTLLIKKGSTCVQMQLTIGGTTATNSWLQVTCP